MDKKLVVTQHSDSLNHERILDGEVLHSCHPSVSAHSQEFHLQSKGSSHDTFTTWKRPAVASSGGLQDENSSNSSVTPS